jgi:hypothetical protein
MPLNEDPEGEALEQLRSEAAALRAESYPGDAMADIRGRLGRRAPRRSIGWLLATAAALAVAVMTERQASRAPAPAPIRPSLSPFRTVVPVPVVAAPPSLAIVPPPQLGQALSFGAGALARVRPPSRPGLAIEEEK